MSNSLATTVPAPIDDTGATDRRSADAYAGGIRRFLIRALAGSGAVQAFGMLLAFLIGVQLARGLGVEGYGYYGMAMAVIAIASIPGELGLPKLVTREVAASSSGGEFDLPRLFGVMRWADRTTILIAVPGAALLGGGAYWFLRESTPVLAVSLAAGAPIIPLVALAKIRGATLQGLHAIVLGQLPNNLVRPLLFSVLLLGLFTLDSGASATEAMALNSITAVAGLIVAHLLLRTRLPRERPTRLTDGGSKWLASALPIALTEGMRTVQAQIVVLLLGILASADQVGLFRMAVSTGAMVAAPVALVNGVMAPVFARMIAQGDHTRVQQLSRRSAQLMAGSALALSLAALLPGPGLLSLIFGPDFAPAYPALVLICLGQFINASFGPNGNLLVMSGHERRVTRAMAVSLVGGVAALFALAPGFGIVGAAWATIVSLLIWNALLWRDTRRLLGIDTSLLSVLRR